MLSEQASHVRASACPLAAWTSSAHFTCSAAVSPHPLPACFNGFDLLSGLCQNATSAGETGGEERQKGLICTHFSPPQRFHCVRTSLCPDSRSWRTPWQGGRGCYWAPAGNENPPPTSSERKPFSLISPPSWQQVPILVLALPQLPATGCSLQSRPALHLRSLGIASDNRGIQCRCLSLMCTL